MKIENIKSIVSLAFIAGIFLFMGCNPANMVRLWQLPILTQWDEDWWEQVEAGLNL